MIATQKRLNAPAPRATATRPFHIGHTVGLPPLVTVPSVTVAGVLFGGLAVVLAVPFASAVATLVDVLVLGHDRPAAEPRRTLRPSR